MPAGPAPKPVPDLICRQHAEQPFQSAGTQTIRNFPDDPDRRGLALRSVQEQSHYVSWVHLFGEFPITE